VLDKVALLEGVGERAEAGIQTRFKIGLREANSVLRFQDRARS
jgi:hypothetical protein